MSISDLATDQSIPMNEAATTLTIPFAFAKRHGVLVTPSHEGPPTVLMRHGFSPLALAELGRNIPTGFKLRCISADEFDKTLRSAYEDNSSQSMAIMGEVGEDMDLNSIAQALPEPQDLLESDDDAPVIRLINALFTEAVKENASDIHVEPFESRLLVRFRVDGVLREILEPARVLAPILVSRIKVMAKLDIAEKRLPQDGRISLRIAGRAVDVRVSTMPAGHGERVVMRLLDKQAGRIDLERLGMAPHDLRSINEVIQRPHGIILVTGPTGSGKTTSLYAMLSRLNNHISNIMTVEDPIEYYLDGISQTQVQTKVDMSFARGLRAILRQDPDVVMVGEIRDLETAEIAVQASLTGHLVLSTLHTNSATGAIVRMRDMGVEAFLLSSSIVGIIAQRLLRLLCPECKTAYEPNREDCEKLNIPFEEGRAIYHSVGCPHCKGMGYIGRTAIFEVVTINDQMRTMIHDGSSEQTLEAAARRRGPGIYDDGMRRVLSGETSVDELLRVIHGA